jgi:hypothetical protein
MPSASIPLCQPGDRPPHHGSGMLAAADQATGLVSGLSKPQRPVHQHQTCGAPGTTGGDGEEPPMPSAAKPQNSTRRKGDKVAISLRGGKTRSLAARFTTLLSGKSSPFVTQSQLIDLVKTDRSDIERQVRQAEWMMRHPQRGMTAVSYRLIDDWRRFLHWIDGAIQHLEQPRPVPELEHLIHAWQDRRGNIVAPNLRWRRRADVIAV